MRILTTIFLSLAFALAAAGQSSDAKAFSVEARRDVKLQLDPSAAFWKGAMPVHLEVDTYGKPVPGYESVVYSRWTKQYLYLLYVCPYQELYLKPDPTTTAETNQLWNWDVAEVFIGSDFANINRYKEFEVSPQGEWVDLDIQLDLPHHEDGWKWNSGFQAEARIDHDRKIWYAAMKIPFSSIDTRPAAAGNEFRINFYRCQGPTATRKYIVWRPTEHNTFHVPAKFGTLTLRSN